MNDNNKVIKSGIWYTLANFLMKAITFIITPLFTRMMSKSDFGLYNNFTSWMNTLCIIVTLNLEATLISARYEFESKLDKYIVSVLSLSTVSGIIWLVIINILKQPIEQMTGIDSVYLNTMMIYFIMVPAVNLFQGRERYFYKYKVSVAISLIISISTAIISILLVSCTENKLAGRIYGTLVPTIIIGLIVYIYLFGKVKGIDTSYWKYALPICLPYIPHLLSLTVLNSMDRIMITKICGSEENALYSLAYTCGTIVTLFMTSLNTAFSPWLGDKLNNNQVSKIKEKSKSYILLFVMLASGAMLLTPEILLIMGGKTYMDAMYVMPPVSFGCVCQFLYALYVNVEQFKKKTVGMAFASISAALLNYALNSFFIPRFGYIAAAYTTLASYLWLLFIHMILVSKLGYKDVYSRRFIFVVLIVITLYTAFMNYLYINKLLRIVCIFVYIGIMVVYALKNKEMLFVLLKRRHK